ncbi:6-hydroxymethylpterin diphosphokinase MptE-like protein [Flavimaricola marinus]|uniref:6-hydroxymethylpterin diphosphokinase MptE-like domain-containing protein n=1 Tax=Flavimaricola marinus TaxID=1819565 RepID=A0A238LI57_9RHOB|nr:6-hydroxymethylpterin diphosphokinase MptE-like protein [Flavimaricola marinus]SMY09223.1 hypothetical protein LOM8899_03388 [Flavimaricola marinus]
MTAIPPVSATGLNDAALEEQFQALVRQVPTRSPIYLPTDKVPLADKVRGMAHVKQIYDVDLEAKYRPRMRALREQFKDTKRCFLIGNGPSLNETDLTLLKDEVTFAVNGFFLKAKELDWKPTFYCVEDHLVAEDRAEWINAFSGPIKFFPAYLGYMFPPGPDTIFYNHQPRVSYPHSFDFSRAADVITYTGCTVTFSMMQLATWLGFEEIYLIGVDASYDIPADVEQGSDYDTGVLDMKSDDPNHFDPDYFGKGFRWHDPQVNQMVEAYKVARATLEGTGQTIYNATVGGQLEVFERRDYASLFGAHQDPGPSPRTRPLGQTGEDSHPRLLVLDMTAMGDKTATGEVKANLLRDWPRHKLMQIASPKPNQLSFVRRTPEGDYGSRMMNAQDVRASIAAFDPEVILYRPLADRPALHDMAMAEISARPDTTLVTWIMDDWPARLEADDPARFATVDAELRGLFARSGLRLTISDAMSSAFAERYGLPFEAFANGIDASHWTAPRQHHGRGIVIRYAGGIAPDMNAASLQRIARTVEARAKAGQDVRLEISTREHWAKVSGHLFDGLHSTSLNTEERSQEDYIRWLCEADVVLIAYNFDAGSQRYVQYSMANKLPECLASGAAVLAHGPRGLATIDRLADLGVADLVDTESADALASAIARLADPEHRRTKGAAARAVALSQFELTGLNTRLAKAFRSAIAAPAVARTQAAPAADADRPDRPVTDAGPTQSEPAIGRPAVTRFYWRPTPDAEYQPVSLSDVTGQPETAGRDPGAFVLSYVDPCVWLSDALREGRSADTALADWNSTLRRHLVVARTLSGKCRYSVAAQLASGTPEADGPDLAPLAAAAMHVLRNAETLRFLAELGGLADSLSTDAIAAMAERTSSPGTASAPDTPQAETALRDARARHNLAEEQVKQLRAMVELYHKDAEALRDELTRIERSTSWRVTQPLRGLRRVLSFRKP